MADSQAYCLRRKNYQSDMIDMFDRMFRDDSMTDVTLMCCDGTIKAHRMLLSACSPYFKTVFDNIPTNYHYYPIVILKDTPVSDLRAIMEFIYRGEVTVSQEQLESVIKNGESLQIKGLIDIEDNKDHECHGTRISKSRKRRRRRRKCSNEDCIKNSDANNEDDDNEMTGDKDSSETSEYSDGEDNNRSLIGTPTDVSSSRNYTESIGASEGDIEPSRLLEQSMITGDTQESNNSVHQYATSNAHHLTTVGEDDVKPIMYDTEPIGLISQMSTGISSHSLAHDGHVDVSHNHSTLVTTASNLINYDTTGLQSIPGTSNSSPSASRSHSSHEQFGHSLHSLHSSANSHLSALSFQSEGCSTLTTLSVSGRRPYHCPICMKTFSEKGNMKRHTQIHLQQRNRYVCDTCGKCFAWKDNFHRHKRSAHTSSISFAK